MRPAPRIARSALSTTASALLLSGAAALALTATAVPAAAGVPLEYYGGPVISNVEVVQISWGDAVDPAYAEQITKFYQTILAGPYLDWLSEYDTLGKVGLLDGLPGSEQHIGRGKLESAHVIAPSIDEMNLSDAEIQAELVAQIKSGALPPPKLDAGGFASTLYMFDFASAYQIKAGAEVSCGTFLAYHGTALLDDLPIPYGVHPDCGDSFNAKTTVHSHELIEAITDPDTGLLATVTRPMGWRTPMKGIATVSQEIADLCPGVAKLDGYSLSKGWSNFAGKCVGEILLCDGKTAPPACRPCNAFDGGVACAGPTPLCALEGALAGQCVACTAADEGACTGDKALCDQATNTCVGCLADADCGDPAMLVCDPTTKTCRGCTANSECKAGVCDSTSDEKAGQCVACVADLDCGADELCQEHACAPRPKADPPPASAPEDSGCSMGRAQSEEGSRGVWLLGLAAALASARRRRG